MARSLGITALSTGLQLNLCACTFASMWSLIELHRALQKYKGWHCPSDYRSETKMCMLLSGIRGFIFHVALVSLGIGALIELAAGFMAHT